MTICRDIHKLLRSKEIMTICSNNDCYQVMYDVGEWSDDYNHKVMDKAMMDNLASMKTGGRPRFSHGYCPEHYREIMKEIRLDRVALYRR